MPDAAFVKADGEKWVGHATLGALPLVDFQAGVAALHFNRPALCGLLYYADFFLTVHVMRQAATRRNRQLPSVAYSDFTKTCAGSSPATGTAFCEEEAATERHGKRLSEVRVLPWPSLTFQDQKRTSRPAGRDK